MADDEKDHGESHLTVDEAVARQMIAAYQEGGHDYGKDRVCGMVVGYLKPDGEIVTTLYSPHGTGASVAIGAVMLRLLKHAEEVGVLDEIGRLGALLTSITDVGNTTIH